MNELDIDYFESKRVWDFFDGTNMVPLHIVEDLVFELLFWIV